MARKAFIFSIFLFCLLDFYFPGVSFASAPQISSFPTGTLQINQEFTVSATMSGLSKNTIYRLRIAIANASNYFGSTWNGTNWYNGTPSPIDYANFLSITTDNTGAWWGDILGEIDGSDPNMPTDSGNYDLKVGRYTASGTSATWSDAVSVAIVFPTPTSIPATPTNTPIPPTNTPLPKIPTATPITKIMLTTPTVALNAYANEASFGAVLGTQSASPTKKETPTPSVMHQQNSQEKNNLLALIMLIAGFCLLAGCGILVFLQTEKGQQIWKKFF